MKGPDQVGEVGAPDYNMNSMEDEMNEDKRLGKDTSSTRSHHRIGGDFGLPGPPVLTNDRTG
jgi:hypothetical protein